MTARRFVLPVLLFLAAVALWEIAVRAFAVPAYILPAPTRVVATFFRHFPLLLGHAGVTLAEILLGLLLGGAGGLGLAILLYSSTALRQALQPFLIASQMMPVFAIAPLLIVWLGYGLGPKVAVAALIGFFPVAVNTLDGLCATPQDRIDLFRTMGASPGQMLRKLLFPTALPSLFSGLKVAATLSVVGATIGEWVGARRGLGYLMLQSNARLRVDLVFAAILMLTTIGLSLFAGFRIIERRVLHWAIHHRPPE
ncbi:MAG: ABC transporter permease [Candidatus Bipolaricaulis sp.]|nr:ABC transporter permease [Candidatus Bipolaricaulis sp.]MDD5646488.1 ABC transporter permease [Candidatus Bipolaricaulis sp.]